jgi:uncharacterized membrane protein
MSARRPARKAEVSPASAPRRGGAPGAPALAVATRAAPARLVGVDALRGLAIVAMAAYHFAFDLRYFGVTRSDFEHAWPWLVARAAILGTFLLLVGISLALAARAGVAWRHHLARVARIAACALAVSVASYAMFPQSFIYFGVLHAIAVVSLVAWPLRARPVAAAAIGVVIVAAGLAIASPGFDPRAWSWIGFVATKPRTEDFVPLFPWAGVVLVGIGAGHALSRRDFAAVRPLARAPAWLALLGRHSLLVYMVHQPILIGALWIALRIAR